MAVLRVIDKPAAIGRPVLTVERQGTGPDEPLVVSEGWPEQHTCGSCGMVLVQAPMGWFMNLVLECPSCGAYNEGLEQNPEAAALSREVRRKSRLPWRR